MLVSFLLGPSERYFVDVVFAMYLLFNERGASLAHSFGKLTPVYFLLTYLSFSLYQSFVSMYRLTGAHLSY